MGRLNELQQELDREYSKVLTEMLHFFWNAAGLTDEAGSLRRKEGVSSWSSLRDDRLMEILKKLQARSNRPCPSRDRIMRIAKIRILASNSAGYGGDALFSLADDRLKRIEGGLAFGAPAAKPSPSPVKSLLSANCPEANYLRWRATPAGRGAFAMAEELTLEAWRNGVIRWGMKAIFENRRWGQGIVNCGAWTNTYTAPLAREMRKAHPDLPSEFFKMNPAASDNWASLAIAPKAR